MHRATAKSEATMLIRKLGPFVPDHILYIERGGRSLGLALADQLKVDASGIDIGYPLSRLSHPLLRALVFPIKEICYRLSRPRLVRPPALLTERRLEAKKILLVDDSASSGKTLDIAVHLLESAGVNPIDVHVAVGRAGKRAYTCPYPLSHLA